jgi:hypothetical protein
MKAVHFKIPKGLDRIVSFDGTTVRTEFTDGASCFLSEPDDTHLHHAIELGLATPLLAVLHHELAHNLVARARGQGNDCIVYWSAHNIPIPVVSGKTEEWLVTNVQYLHKRRYDNAHLDFTAFSVLRSEGVSVEDLIHDMIRYWKRLT